MLDSGTSCHRWDAVETGPPWARLTGEDKRPEATAPWVGRGGRAGWTTPEEGVGARPGAASGGPQKGRLNPKNGASRPRSGNSGLVLRAG